MKKGNYKNTNRNRNSNSNKKDYGKYLLKNKDEIIEKKRRNKRIKRIILLSIILIAILIALCLNLQYFNIKKVIVEGNNVVSTQTILDTSKIKTGGNIFKFISKSAKDNLTNNPYIKTVNIKRRLPDKVVIKVVEKASVFYTFDGEKYYIMDGNLTVLDKKNNIDGMNLVAIEGIDTSILKVGEIVSISDEYKRKSFEYIGSFISTAEFKKQHKAKTIKLNNFMNVMLYVDDAYIKLGTMDNMEEKLRKAMIILNDEKFKGLKGYVDVSFDGNPVVYSEE